jgi:hypothetical protein
MSSILICTVTPFFMYNFLITAQVGQHHQYPLNMSWMGPRAGLHGLEKRKVPYLFWESNLDSSAVEPLA